MSVTVRSLLLDRKKIRNDKVQHRFFKGEFEAAKSDGIVLVCGSASRERVLMKEVLNQGGASG